MDVECRRLLARFLSRFSSSSAKWLPILFNVENSLSLFLGLDYHLRYIPLLSKCGLVKEKTGANGLKTYTLCQTSSQKGGCSWNSFFAEYNLCGVELSTCYIKQFHKQLHFLRVKVFHESPFTAIEQYQKNLLTPIRRGLRQKQLQLGRKLAPTLPLNIDVETPYDDSSASVPPFESSNDFTKDKTDVKNLKVLLKEIFLLLF